MAAHVLVVRVFVGLGKHHEDKLIITRNFKMADAAKALTFYNNTARVYEQKCNRGEASSYKLSMVEQDRAGAKDMKVVAVLAERRIFPVGTPGA